MRARLSRQASTPTLSSSREGDNAATNAAAENDEPTSATRSRRSKWMHIDRRRLLPLLNGLSGVFKSSTEGKQGAGALAHSSSCPSLKHAGEPSSQKKAKTGSSPKKGSHQPDQHQPDCPETERPAVTESAVAMELIKEIGLATPTGDNTSLAIKEESGGEDSLQLPLELLQAMGQQQSMESSTADLQLSLAPLPSQTEKASFTEPSGDTDSSVDPQAQATPRRPRPGSYRGYSKGSSSSGSPAAKVRKQWCGSGLVSTMSSRPTTAGDLASRSSFSASSARSWQASKSPRGNIYMPTVNVAKLAPPPPLPPLPPQLEEDSCDKELQMIANEVNNGPAAAPPKKATAEQIKQAIANAGLSNATPPPVGRWRLPPTPRPSTAGSTSAKVLTGGDDAKAAPLALKDAIDEEAEPTDATASRQPAISDECMSNVTLNDFSELALSFACIE